MDLHYLTIPKSGDNVTAGFENVSFCDSLAKPSHQPSVMHPVDVQNQGGYVNE